MFFRGRVKVFASFGLLSRLFLSVIFSLCEELRKSWFSSAGEIALSEAYRSKKAPKAIVKYKIASSESITRQSCQRVLVVDANSMAVT